MPKVISFGTGKQTYYDLFLDSCDRNNIEPVILGWNEKWIGHGRKLAAIRDYMKILPEKEIVIVVDPFDVIFLCGLDEIEYKFNRTSSSFLCGALKLGNISGSIYNYEFNRTGNKPPSTPTGYNYLNSGTWISRAGYAQYLIDELVDKYKMKDDSIDQQLLTGFYVKKLYNVDIDWQCDIFHNLLFTDFLTRHPDLKDLKFTDNRVLNISSGSKPCILHASDNTSMRYLASKLGYPSHLLKPVNNSSNFRWKAVSHFKQIMKSKRHDSQTQ